MDAAIPSVLAMLLQHKRFGANRLPQSTARGNHSGRSGYFSDEQRMFPGGGSSVRAMLSLRVRETSAVRRQRPRERTKQSKKLKTLGVRERAHTYLEVEGVRLVVVGAGAMAVAIVQPHPVLPQLLPDELVVDEGGASELRQHQPRHQQQLRLVPQRYPAREGQINRVLTSV